MGFLYRIEVVCDECGNRETTETRTDTATAIYEDTMGTKDAERQLRAKGWHFVPGKATCPNHVLYG